MTVERGRVVGRRKKSDEGVAAGAEAERAPSRIKAHPERLALVGLAQVRRSMQNPRSIDEKSPGFVELVSNVRAAGVLVPVHL